MVILKLSFIPKICGRDFLCVVTHIVIVVNVSAILLLIDLNDLHVDRCSLMLFNSYDQRSESKVNDSNQGFHHVKSKLLYFLLKYISIIFNLADIWLVVPHAFV